MIKTLTRAELGDKVFDNLMMRMIDESESEHRKGSQFFVKWIVRIDESDIQDRPDLAGFWETNQFVWSEDDYDKKEIHTLTRVEKKEILRHEVVWAPVESEEMENE